MVQIQGTLAALNGDRHPHASAFAARNAANVENSPEQGGSFPHAQEPHRFTVKYFSTFYSPAVVLYLKGDLPVSLF